MRPCDLDEIKVCVDRQYENCHGYSGSKKAIYREAILAIKSILHSVKAIDAVEVVRCKDCKYCNISLVLPTGRKMYNCMEGSHDHQTLLKSNDFCSYGERKEGADNGVTVRHGRWVDKGEYAVCMECGGRSGTQYDGVELIPLMTQFCPNCGCRMDGGDE